MNVWIEEYKKFHKEHSNYGSGGAIKFYWKHIDDLIKDTKAETLLDFGCGKGTVYEAVSYTHLTLPTIGEV